MWKRFHINFIKQTFLLFIYIKVNWFTFNNSGHFGKRRLPFYDSCDRGESRFTFNDPCDLGYGRFSLNDPGDLGQGWLSLNDPGDLGQGWISLNNTWSLNNSGHFGDFRNWKTICVRDEKQALTI